MVDEQPKRKKKAADYAWISVAITALVTSIGSVVTQRDDVARQNVVQKSVYETAAKQIAVLEYRVAQLEQQTKDRETRLKLRLTSPNNAPASLPVFEDLKAKALERRNDE